MELLSAYFYNMSPIKMTEISEETFSHLYDRSWYKDDRNPKGFQIINKRFLIQDKWYRVALRFKRVSDSVGAELFELDTPVPFMVIHTEMMETSGGSHDISIRFKDLHVWHGKQVKTTVGYLQEGVPLQLIDEVIADLKDAVVYKGDVKLRLKRDRRQLDIGGNQRINPIQMISRSGTQEMIETINFDAITQERGEPYVSERD